MRRHFKDIKIDKDHISIISSGPSSWDISDDDYKYIYDNSYVIGLNECLRPIHARIWSDYRVSVKLNKYYKNNEVKCVLISRDYAFKHCKPEILRNLVNYWYDREDTAKRSYTVLTLLEMVKKYFPDKKILIFGLDCNINDIRRKTLNEDNEIEIQKQEIYKQNLLEVKKMFENKLVDFYKNIWNCNLFSQVNIPKAHYREII